MVLLSPNSFVKKPNTPFDFGSQYPAPPEHPSSAAVPAPQPPQIAPPPPQTQGYGVSGPPAPVQPPAADPNHPSPYAATGVKGQMSSHPYGPGMVTNAAASQAPDVSTGPSMGTPAPTPGGQPAGPASLFSGSDDQKLAFIKAHPENFDTNISDGQWKVWLKHLDSSCPTTKPFKTERPGPGGSSFNGPEKCVEKPDNCPDGFHVVGNDSRGVAGCQPDGGAPGGVGGYGGGPGSPGHGGPGSGSPGYVTNTGSGGPSYGDPNQQGFGGISDMLGKIISGNLQGQNSRYTPEAIAALLSQTKMTAEDQSQQERDAINEDAAARGVLGAGATGTALANARIGANRTVANEQGNIARAKIDADFQDKQQAIQNAQTYLDQARDWAYKQQMTAMQRQQFEANLSLAYARMQQDWDSLKAQYGYQSLLGGV